jgi:YD repeat-containing protein
VDLGGGGGVTYGYDGLGEAVTMTSSDGVFSYAYDDGGNRVSVTRASIIPLVSTYAYDLFDRRTLAIVVIGGALDHHVAGRLIRPCLLRVQEGRAATSQARRQEVATAGGVSAWLHVRSPGCSVQDAVGSRVLELLQLAEGVVQVGEVDLQDVPGGVQ